MMSEPDFAQTVTSHEAAFVNITSHSVYASLGRILPNGKVASVGKYGFVGTVLGYHKRIVVKFTAKMLVVEIGSGIKKRFLPVGFFHKRKKLEK